MRHLVDAHSLIWALDDPRRLRLLVAQCLVEAISIVSADSVFEQYGVGRIWD